MKVFARTQAPAFQSRRLGALLAGLAMLGAGWGLLWGPEWRWNPLAFTVLWTGAATVMWSASRVGYPGIKRHVVLAALSVPAWWWFELVNARVRNWEYVRTFEYSSAEWAVLQSLAFATVIPAIVSAVELVRSFLSAPQPEPPRSVSATDAHVSRWEVALGVGLQILVFIFPEQLFPLVWVAPFVVLDGLVALAGGRRISAGLLKGQWREVAMIALAGLLCGVLWEFWNYLATPKWVYHIPLVGFAKIFEMPTLGYGGYIPFAWSIVKFVQLIDLMAHRFAGRPVSRRKHTVAAAD